MKNQAKNDDKDFWIQLSSWWGQSEKPGSVTFTIQEDGKYTRELEFYRHPDENTQVEGQLTSKEIEILKEFVDQHITASFSGTIIDAGYTIKIIRNGELITIENDKRLFSKIRKLVPYY